MKTSEIQFCTGRYVTHTKIARQSCCCQGLWGREVERHPGCRRAAGLAASHLQLPPGGTCWQQTAGPPVQTVVLGRALRNPANASEGRSRRCRLVVFSVRAGLQKVRVQRVRPPPALLPARMRVHRRLGRLPHLARHHGRLFGGATCRSRPRRLAARLAIPRVADSQPLLSRPRAVANLAARPPGLASLPIRAARRLLLACRYPRRGSHHALAGSHASCASATTALAPPNCLRALWPVTRLRRASRLAR